MIAPQVYRTKMDKVLIQYQHENNMKAYHRTLKLLTKLVVFTNLINCLYFRIWVPTAAV